MRAVDTLSNLIAKADKNDGREIAYLIHKICEADYIDITLAREVQHWQIALNSDLFVSVKREEVL